MIENIKNSIWRLSERSETRFGAIALTLLVAAALIAGMTVVLRPGWGNPIAAFARLLIYLSFFASPVFGAIGIIRDRHRFFAITTVAIFVGVVLYILICYWLAASYSNMLK